MNFGGSANEPALAESLRLQNPGWNARRQRPPRNQWQTPRWQHQYNRGRARFCVVLSCSLGAWLTIEGLGILGVTVRTVNLTDDELWRAISENTSAVSNLVDQQPDMDEKIGSANAADRTNLIRSRLELINQYQREYRDYTAELRRRHKIDETGGQRIAEESARRILSNASVDDAFASAN